LYKRRIEQEEEEEGEEGGVEDEENPRETWKKMRRLRSLTFPR